MVRFGGKAFAPQLGDLLLSQATALIVMAALGPASVAVFARSRGLIRNARILVSRYSVVIVPTASALHAMGRRDELRRQLIDSTRTGLFLALPFVLVFSILGGQLLRVWMGPAYEQATLLALLSCGYLCVMAMQPALSVLSGMNEHGRAGLARVLGAIAAICGVGFVLGPFEGGLTAVGVALAVPMVLVDGIYLPIYVCRRLAIPLPQFVREAAVRPVLCALPLALSFAVARGLFADRAWLAVASGSAGAILLAGPLYWRYGVREAVLRAFPSQLGGPGRFLTRSGSRAHRSEEDRR
jgi:O-antigen/teichoic acid export membrane protein